MPVFSVRRANGVEIATVCGPDLASARVIAHNAGMYRYHPTIFNIELDPDPQINLKRDRDGFAWRNAQ